MMQPPLSPGDMLLDKYRVERVLGRGGMGFVVAARHVDLDELFAIKLMLPGALDDADAERRFLREARAAVRLKGEHAVRVHDVGRREDDSLYMVMEHLVGTDLKTHLAERGPLPVEEAVSYAIQVCEGIGEAHDLGIVHRDVKPANLFLTRRRNGTACIKVLDFGISKQISAKHSQDLTKSGAMLGSPLYMSPEQMTHAHEVDGRTDLWSLGVVLYELLTGKVPFEGESFTQVVYRVTNLAPQRLRALRPELPPEVEAVVMRCLEKDPDRRFESADALAAALRRPLLDPPSSTRSLALADTVDRTTGEAPPRPRPSAPSAGESTAGQATTVMSSSRDGLSSSRAQPDKGEARPGKGALLLGGLGAAVLATIALLGLRPSLSGEAPPEPVAAPAAPAPAETAPSAPPEAPAVTSPPPEAAPAPAASAAPAAHAPAAPVARPAKAAPPAGANVGKPEPTATPSATPAPTSSATPRKHSLY